MQKITAKFELDHHLRNTVILNYGNPYEKWSIFIAWPHLWLKLGMIKPEIMLCEMVLNLSTLHYVTAQYPVTWRHVIGLVRQVSYLKWRPQISFLLGPRCKSVWLQTVVGNSGEGLQEWISALGLPVLIKQLDCGAHVFVHALKLKADTLNIHCVSNVFC